MARLNLFMNYFVMKFARKLGGKYRQDSLALIVNPLKPPVSEVIVAGLMEAKRSKDVSVIL